MTTDILPQSKRLLLVDDDHAIRRLLGQFIGSLGFDITYAENGKRALELFDSSHGNFELLVTDIIMPELNGNDLIREIRNRDALLPIIAITGFAKPDLIRDIQSFNAKLFQKPIRFETLKSHINSLFTPQINK